MSAEIPPSELPADVDRGQTLIIVWWTEIALASIFIFLRVFARRLRRSLGIDDVVMICAWVCVPLMNFGDGFPSRRIGTNFALASFSS